ncbi:hypothetical protein C9374_004984 [Naegleria lovaniensis]|uniref:Uncharacterized protein n=1 Tax=Naegleria lovaniensis TaxID=51637 RepID=A0AA88GRI6_NAELO|nr:uncharacterized protein C9374_004984 [Naegleria lovaniensis]KAG2383017.1 hypothetical protein C9374_004984 [Naegleria lovaniensis]
MSVWEEGSWEFPMICSLPLLKSTTNTPLDHQEAALSDHEINNSNTSCSANDSNISKLNSKYSFGNFILKRSVSNGNLDYPRVMFYPPSSLWYKNRFTYFEIMLHEPCRDIAAQQEPSSSNALLQIAIGFSKRKNFFGVLGWTEDTIGFHFDNGRVYDHVQITSSIKDQVYICDVAFGQVYGCLLDHEIGEFHITRNGVLLRNSKGNRFVRKSFCERENAFLPTISCFDVDVELEVNLGCDLVRRPFRYCPLVRYDQAEKLFSMLNIGNEKNRMTETWPNESFRPSVYTYLFFTDIQVKTI